MLKHVETCPWTWHNLTTCLASPEHWGVTTVCFSTICNLKSAHLAPILHLVDGGLQRRRTAANIWAAFKNTQEQCIREFIYGVAAKKTRKNFAKECQKTSKDNAPQKHRRSDSQQGCSGAVCFVIFVSLLGITIFWYILYILYGLSHILLSRVEESTCVMACRRVEVCAMQRGYR